MSDTASYRLLILVGNLPAFYFLLKFCVCWEKMSRCEERFLTWKAQYPHLLLREQCIDRERSEDTLPNLLRNVNRSASARVFPRSCYKLSTGWGKAGPALRCNNKCGYERPSVRNTSCRRIIFTLNNYKFYTYFIQTLNSFNWFFPYTILYSSHIKISDRFHFHFLCLMSNK